MEEKALTFKKGLKDAVPIGLGYFSVSAAFGMICVNNGLPIWAGPFMSLTNFTGTGQFVGAEMIAASALIIELLLTILVINARYFLMSVSLSQRLAPKVGFWKRAVIAFGVTDEVFAVAMQQNRAIRFKYYVGLMITSFAGWLGGTVIGSLIGSIIPVELVSAMGIAIYAMFIAIIIPPAKKSRAVFAVIAIAAVLNCILTYVPLFSFLDSSLCVIISGIAAALIGSFAFPRETEEFDE